MNPNDYVLVKPTDAGWRQIVASVDSFNDDLRRRDPNCRFRQSIPQPDDNGFIRGQLWCVMRYFDWSRGIGDCPFSEMMAAPVTGTAWTDEPTAEQRLEAVRHAVSDWRHSNPMMVIQYLVEILSDNWRPGKTEGKS